MALLKYNNGQRPSPIAPFNTMPQHNQGRTEATNKEVTNDTPGASNNEGEDKDQRYCKNHSARKLTVATKSKSR